MYLMTKFKKYRLFVLFILTIFFVFFALFYKNKKVVTLQNGSNFPYLEMEICVDTKAGELLNDYNYKDNVNDFINYSLDKALEKCDFIIDEVIKLAVLGHKNQFSVDSVESQKFLFLKQKINKNIKDKYSSIYVDYLKNINEYNDYKMKYDIQTKTVLKSKLEQSDSDFKDLVYSLGE